MDNEPEEQSKLVPIMAIVIVLLIATPILLLGKGWWIVVQWILGL